MALFLDDLHWADEGTLSLLHHLTRNLGDARLLIVGAYRPEEMNGGGLEETLRQLSPLPAFRTIAVPPLDAQETKSLVDAILERIAPDGGPAAAIHARSQGNPLFTIEIARYLKEATPADADDRSAQEEPPLPQTIADVLMRRLARVPAADRDLLDLAAVEGESFDADTLAVGTGASRLDTLRRLRALEQVHRLVRSDDDGYRFSHGMIREVLLHAIPKQMRREYHGVVADHLIRRYRERPAYAGRIGEQLAEAHRFAEAVPFLTDAAREARRLFLSDRALAFIQRALDVLDRAEPRGARRGELLRMKCEALLMLGRPHLARGVAEEAAAEEERSGTPRGRAMSEEARGDAALAQGDFVAAERFLDAARRRYADLGERHDVARSVHKLGAVAARRGELEQGLERLTEALDGMRESGTDLDVARVRLDLGDVLYRRGDNDHALATFEAAVAELRRLAQRHDLARGITRLGNVLFQLGRTDRALESYQEALALASRLGDLQAMARLEANLGNVHLVRGELEPATARYRGALAAFEEIGDPAGACQTRVALGNVGFMRGDFEEAAGFYRDSLEAREALGDRLGLANALDNLGVVECQLGRFASALEHQQAALRLRAELGDRPGVIESSLNLGSLKAAIGEPGAAADFFAAAHRAAIEIGDSRRAARALLATAFVQHGASDRAGRDETMRAVRGLEIDDPAFRGRRRLLEALADADPAASEAAFADALLEAERSRSIGDQATARLALAGHHLRLGRTEPGGVRGGGGASRGRGPDPAARAARAAPRAGARARPRRGSPGTRGADRAADRGSRVAASRAATVRRWASPSGLPAALTAEKSLHFSRRAGAILMPPPQKTHAKLIRSSERIP